MGGGFVGLRPYVSQLSYTIPDPRRARIADADAGAGGYREHDILVVGKSGAENIIKYPFGPEFNVVG